MTSLNFDDQDGILRTISDAPPTYYTVKIQSVSLLTEKSLEKYESGDFEAKGYKWKLVFYPNGNKNRNVKEHISLYLVMLRSNAPQISLEVCYFQVLFARSEQRQLLCFSRYYFLLRKKLRVPNSNTKQRKRRFHRMKPDWGFDHFLSHKIFTEASNGFLIDDICVSTGKGECLSMVKDPIMYKNIWRIHNFSKLDGESYDSKVFTAGDQKWYLYIALAEPKSLPPSCKIYAEFTLRLLNQFNASNLEWGWWRFITLGFFNQATMGFVLKDTCFVEAEVIVHGITSAL
ncbi:unnamed protein product [Malus baccata var. baccata]